MPLHGCASIDLYFSKLPEMAPNPESKICRALSQIVKKCPLPEEPPFSTQGVSAPQTYGSHAGKIRDVPHRRPEYELVRMLKDLFPPPFLILPFQCFSIIAEKGWASGGV
jgi:hypothetical protein